MANTIKNLPEFIETEGQYEQALKIRQKSIPTFSLLGPPDLCYVTKEFQRSLNLSLSKNSVHGFYHFNYGLCPATPVAVSEYFNKLIKEQETESNWFSNGKWIISKATYCIFDIFARVDVRIEVSLSGGIHLYGINPNEELVQLDEKDWETAYISSVLRAMKPEKIPIVKLYKEFTSLEELEHFFELISNLIGKIDLPIEPYELLAVKGNKILDIICQYLIKKKRYPLGIKFFNMLAEWDFHNVVFLSHIFDSIGNSLDTIKFIAPLLQKFPHCFSLIYQEAYSLLQMKRYDLAGKLTWSLIQMIPEAFEAWILLMEIYYLSKNYDAALVTLNIAPVNPKKNFNNGFCYPTEEKVLLECLTEPKEKGHSDYFYFNFEVETPDFRYTKVNEEFKFVQNDYYEENRKKEDKIQQLTANKYTDQELQLYQMLVKIEKEISWEKLLILRAQLFLMEENTSKSFNKNGFRQLPPKPIPKSSKMEDYEIFEENEGNFEGTLGEIYQMPMSGISGQTDPFLKGQQKAQEILGKKKPIDTPNEVLNETDEDDSDKEHELPSFLKPEEDSMVNTNTKLPPGPNQSNPYNKKLEYTEEMSQSIQVNYPAGSLSNDEKIIVPVKPVKVTDDIEILAKKKPKLSEKEEKELQSHELSIRNMTKKKGIDGVPFENPLLDFSKKRLCSKLTDSLFEALYEDLSSLYEWSHEEFVKQNKKNLKRQIEEEDEDYEPREEEDEEDYIEDLKISGKLWVLRGMLAQRLERNRYAETAYRKAVERGFSLFAWRKLLGVYLEIENFKAALVCMAEILDELENEGVESFIFLPKWIEEGILHIISKVGYKGLTNLLSELNLDDPNINDLIKEAAYWKVEGAASI